MDLNLINLLNVIVLLLIIYYLSKNIKYKEGFKSSLIPEPKASSFFFNDNKILKFTTNHIPSLRLGVISNDFISISLGNYFKNNIYPMNIINSESSLLNIKKLLNNEVDLAFVNEDILTNIINNDKNLLTLIKEENNSNILKHISALAVLYYNYMFLITKNTIIDNDKTDNLITDIKIIGVLNKYSDSYYHLIKLVNALKYIEGNNFTAIIKEFDTLNELSSALKNDVIDTIYITANEYNYSLNKLTNEINVVFLHFISNDIVQNINNNNNNKIYDIYFRNMYNKTINIENKVMYLGKLYKRKKHYQKAADLEQYNKNITLGNFYKNTNTNTFYKTKASRMLLVTRNDVKSNSINKIINNIINNGENINMYVNNDFNNKVITKTNNIFNIEEQVSINEKIPLHKNMKNIYKSIGFITEIKK